MSGDTNGRQWRFSRRKFLAGGAVTAAAAATDIAGFMSAAGAATNPIVTENSLPGTTDDWDLLYLDDAVEGFATNYSVNAGETVGFKVRTAASSYEIKIYRIGWYGGAGARKVATISPSASLPQVQPDPYHDVDTGLVDCANWNLSASWQVPAAAVSGVYVANFELLDGSGSRNRTLFVVRNDGRTSDLLVQTSDTTYQAYNRWGGSSLYGGTAFWGRASKVSYNRPYNPDELENDFFYAEAPLVRWLERNGYDVSYFGNVDTATRPAELLKHKIFVSSGHDEYWSASMRSNVEAARDAGVHLVFMTGNECYWRVRWEDSPVSSESYKTLVCYKETLNDSKIDPSSEWTGTWRDGRFSPPAVGGGNPENALTGTLFKAINELADEDFAIKVPSTYSGLRFWRNTPVASLTPGSTATLSPATLGYEWNTDADNGARPAGLIRLSETTETVNQVLQDNGGTFVPGALTHYMTMYRAPSGALVWSTGSVQWSWGLDGQHTNRPDLAIPTSATMQQATVNALADMGVQPATRQAGLVAASASADAVPPVATISAPADGASGPVGSAVNVAGTAIDSGGGVVAAVEVSTDGGATWHPAQGTTSWSYSFVPSVVGPTTLLARATDDSCNTGAPSAGRTFNGVIQAMPASIWPTGVPIAPSVSDASAVELGVKFRSDLDGFITGIRFYKGTGNTGSHVGRLWSSGGALLGSVAFVDETASGWQLARFSAPIAISSGVTYVASYSAPNGRYAADSGGLSSSHELAPLRALASGDDGPNGVFGSVGSFPTSTYGSANYWVDIEFDVDNGAPPAVLDHSPAASVSSVATTATVVAIMNEQLQPGSAQLALTGPLGPVSGTVVENSAARSLTFTPSTDLSPLTTYTATVSGGVDLSAEPMAPMSWEFTTAGLPGALPGSIWTSSDEPETASVNDGGAVELGLRFSSSVAGIATAVRFFKGPGNGGSHVGRLYDIAGNVLGTATFANESGGGWQEAPLDSPVSLTKDAVYVVSYFAPEGRYAVTSGGLNSGVVRGPLRALPGSQVGGNGVYTYGAQGGFPVSSWGNGNYWVDLVMEGIPDTSGPMVTNTVPAPGLIAVALTEPVVVTFDGAVNTGSVVFELRRNGSVVPGSVSFPDAVTAVFTPASDLVAGAAYDATIEAVDTSGNAMASPYAWSFTAATTSGGFPATIWTTATTPDVAGADDSGSIEVGVKFSADVNGSVTAIRYFRGPGNDGPHVGHLWNAQGDLLGSVSFANESAEGWQQANFATAIPISAGATYVASYHAPNGHYAHTSNGLGSAVVRTPLRALASGGNGGNGVYRYGASAFPDQTYGAANYFVDLVFIDDGGPAVLDVSPAHASTGIGLSPTLTVTMSEPIASGTFSAELRDGGGVLVPVTTTQSDPTSFSIVPNSSLASATTYTAAVVAANDLGGNAITAPFMWSFTTLDSSVVNLFGTAVPSTAAANDASAVELGMKFRITEPAEVIGIRFYRGAGNTGPQVGHLWSSSGSQLAEVTFSTGGADGWQNAQLSSPVPLTVGDTYVVSYLAPAGHYAVTTAYFNPGDVVNGPIIGQGNAGSDPNGLYVYGGGFPTSSFGGSNYWVDVVVRTTGGGQ